MEEDKANPTTDTFWNVPLSNANDLLLLDIDECSAGHCQNGATCYNGLNEYNCTCAPGYTGTNCDVGKLSIT